MKKGPVSLVLVLLIMILFGCVPPTVEPTDQVEPSLVPYKTPTSTANPAYTLEAMVEPTRLDPTPTPWVHIVQENDTLLGIANRYGVTLDDLLLANPDIDPRLLTIGQEIVIPGPEGDTGPVVLPTPTPLPLMLSPVSCYPSPSGGLWCILSVDNATNDTIEGISVAISLLDSFGEVIQSEPAYSPHNILPPAARMPMAIQFPSTPEENYTPFGRLLSAIRSSEISVRYILPAVEEVESTHSANGRQMSLSGSIVVGELDEGTSVDISLLALGLNADGQVVGYTKWVSENLTSSQDVPFEVTIISLGPEIEDYELLVEGRLDGGQ